MPTALQIHHLIFRIVAPHALEIHVKTLHTRRPVGNVKARTMKRIVLLMFIAPRKQSKLEVVSLEERLVLA
jgi:hypothetical protein